MSEQSHTDDAQNEVIEDLEVNPEDGEDVRGGKPKVSEIQIVKVVDKSTPTLSP
jgi:type VI protein secretion system component Hcp